MRLVYSLKYVILFLFNSVVPYAQDLAQTWQLADEQLNIGNYSNALALYARVSFFGNEEIKLSCYIAKGDCYFQMHEYNKSIEEYDNAIERDCPDSLKNELYIRKAYCFLFQNNFNSALDEIKKMEEGRNKEFLSRKQLHLGLMEFLIFSFKSSEKNLLAYTNANCPHKSEELMQIFNNTLKIKRRKKSKLWVSSVIIPGSGQMIYADYKNGVNSLLLNSSLFALTYYVGYSYGIPDAALTVFPWSYRYYSSGIKKSHTAAKDCVKELHGEAFNEVLELCNECMEVGIE